MFLGVCLEIVAVFVSLFSTQKRIPRPTPDGVSGKAWVQTPM